MSSTAGLGFTLPLPLQPANAPKELDVQAFTRVVHELPAEWLRYFKGSQHVFETLNWYQESVVEESTCQEIRLKELTRQNTEAQQKIAQLETQLLDAQKRLAGGKSVTEKSTRQETQLKELTRQNTEAQQKIAQLETQLSDAQQRLADGKSEKMPDPPMFDGTSDKLPGFLIDLRGKMILNKDRFPTEQAKLCYAFARLTGAAKYYMSRYFMGQTPGRICSLPDLESFVDLLKDAFRDPRRPLRIELPSHGRRQRAPDRF